MFSVLIYYKDRSIFACLPDMQTGERQVLLSAEETGWKESCLIRFFAIDGLWRVACPAGMAWKSDEPFPVDRAISDGFNMSAAGAGRLFGLYCRALKREDTAMKKYLTGEFLTIGKSHSDIVLEDKFISERHCVITRGADGYQFKDISKNGSFVNGRRVLGQSVPLRAGDIVTLACGFRLAFFGEYFAVNSGGFLKAVQKEPVTARIRYDASSAAPAYVRIARPPHFYPSLEPVSYQLEPVPTPDEGDKQPLLIAMGPSLTMSLPMIMGSFLAGTGGYAKAGVIMMVTSSALAVGWTLVNHFYRKRQSQRAFLERMEDYIERLGNFEAEAEQRMNEMVDTLLKMHPSAQECCDFALQRSTHLWQNVPEAAAFLTLRLGTGMSRLPCEVVTPKLKMGEQPQGIANAPYEAAERLNKLYRVPICVPLEEKSPVGVIYTQETIEHVQSLLLQLVCLNSYTDCHLAVLGEEGSEARWRELRFLPHAAFENDPSQHMVAISADAKRSLLRDLSALLQYRAGQEQANGAGAPAPRYIVVCEDEVLWADNAFFRVAAQEGAGFCLVMLARTRDALPKECTRIVDLSGPGEGVLYDRVQGTQTAFKPEQVLRAQLLDAFAALAPLRDNEQANSNAIPGNVDFLESFGVRTARELDIWRSWNTQSTSRNIEANIGFKAGARPFLLDVSDKAHGPHGLVAGTTGSGKSVLLQTIVLSLAAKYSPVELQFILIDYKGGGAFACFRDLPHVVGLIDNLNGRRTVLRALASVNGEILRRQAIFKRLGVSDINDYIRLHNPDPSLPPLSHIVIIIDEFAELKEEMPEFIEELISVSRIGRSMGVHLILATQKPSASVSGEIWSNARFHICLRVQTREDSMEMLHRPDAAFIKGMGSGFAQVGNDEIFEQIQTAYSGAAYDPEALPQGARPHLLDERGAFVQFARTEEKARGRSPRISQMDAVLKEICAVTREHANLRVRGQLWRDALPDLLRAETVEAALSSAEAKAFPRRLAVPFGLVDDIARQEQPTACLDLCQTPVVAVVGSAASGKTALLQTLVYSICRNYRPDEVQVCVVGFGGAQLEDLSGYPNVIGVVHGAQDATLRQLRCELLRAAEARQALFDGVRAANFTGYVEAQRADGALQPLPALVVVIDRIGQFLNTLSDNDQAQMIDLIKTSASYGVYFCFSAIEKTEMPYTLRESAFCIPLRQNSLNDYSSLLGEFRFPPNTILPLETPGRGMFLKNGEALELQCALAFGERSDTARSRRLSEDGAARAQGVEVTPAIRITPVPRPMDARALWKIASDAPFAAGLDLPVALRQPELVPVWLDPWRTHMVFAFGKQATGKTALLRSLAAMRAATEGSETYVLHMGEEWPAVASRLNARCLHVGNASEQEWDVWLTALTDALQERNARRKTFPGWESPANERAICARFAPLTLIFDDTERWYGKRPLPPDFAGYMKSIYENGRKYNVAVFSACASNGNSPVLPSREIAELKDRSLGIAPGNTLAGCDPWGVDLPYSKENQSMRPGEGFLIRQGQSVRVILPGDVR